jgi:heme-binding protein
MASSSVFVRRAVLGTLAAGAACAALTIPAAAQPAPPVPPPPAPASDCNASTLAATISSVTENLSTYFAAHPDANQALIDATRQPSFIAVGQFDGYFRDHPDQANEVRGIKQPLIDYKNRCGMQVEPAEALVVLGDL